MPDQIFLSLRFTEAFAEAKALKDSLSKRGISCFLCSVEEGKNIKKEIVEAIDACELMVVLGTKTYGFDTGIGFSTYNELEFAVDEKKPMFLVKMCERFDVAYTRFTLSRGISYYPWTPGSPLDEELVNRIEAKLVSVKDRTDALDLSNSTAANANLSQNLSSNLENLNLGAHGHGGPAFRSPAVLTHGAPRVVAPVKASSPPAKPKVVLYKMTQAILPAGHRVRAGPSLDTEQIGSVEWDTYENNTIPITEIQQNNARVWGKLSPSIYKQLTSSYKFKAHDPFSQGWTLIADGPATYYALDREL